VPPLRERKEDILLLADFFLDVHQRGLGLARVALTDPAKRLLLSNEWPGNVRELDHLLVRAILRARADSGSSDYVSIAPLHLDLPALPDGEPLGVPNAMGAILPEGVRNLAGALDDYRRKLICGALAQADGNWAAAARMLGLHRSNLHHLAKRLGIERRDNSRGK
jgi:anaerobic nitric oxide reductase transcription regulator